MTAPGRKVPKQGLVAVLSAAPRRKQGQERDVVARQPADQAAPRRPAAPTTAAPTTRHRGCGSRGRSSSCCRLVPLIVARPCSGSASSWSLVAAGRPARLVGGGRALRRGADRRRSGRGGRRPPLAKWVLVGRLTRVRAPAVELVRVAQRARRHVRRGASPPRGSPGPRPGRRCSTCGCARWARRSGKGVWCETYWLPEADLVDLRDGVTVNAGLRGADPPVPRPGAQHGHGHPARRRHAGPQQRHPAGGRARAGTLPSARCRW